MSDKKEFVVTIGSTSHGDRCIKIEDEIDKKVGNLKELVEAENQQTTSTVASKQCATPPKIQMVPSILKDRPNFKKYYEPRVLSVGPIHHGEENLRVAEQYKPKLAARFIKESSQEFKDLYETINDKIHELKKYFHEEAVKDYDDKTLGWILFLDGCALLQFIHCLIQGQLKDFKIKDDHIAFAQHDIFLLENQIPFEVLKLLMNMSKLSTDHKESIEKFILRNAVGTGGVKRHQKLDVDKLNPIHLLDLLQNASVRNNEKKSSSCMDKIFSSCCKTNRGEQQSRQSFRNVQELKAAGIYLKRRESSSLTDITFVSLFFAGWLHLPPIIVDDATAPKFLNLIAYECCPDNFSTNYEVTSYICFLDSLIDHAIDVKEMRSEKILYNLLGSDEEVAGLFNEIATDLVPNAETYKDVKIAIQRHYDSRWRTWMAEAYHDHFQ